MGMEMLGKQNPKLQTRILWMVGMETCIYLTFLCRKGLTRGKETDLEHLPRFIPHQLNDAGPSYLVSLRLYRGENLTSLEGISRNTSIRCLLQSLAQGEHSPHAIFLSLPFLLHFLFSFLPANLLLHNLGQFSSALELSGVHSQERGGCPNVDTQINVKSRTPFQLSPVF